MSSAWPGLYQVGAWLLLQTFEILLPAIDAPCWVLRATILLLALGFIPALIFNGRQPHTALERRTSNQVYFSTQPLLRAA